jgi:hypothetical protein
MHTSTYVRAAWIVVSVVSVVTVAALSLMLVYMAFQCRWLTSELYRANRERCVPIVQTLSARDLAPAAADRAVGLDVVAVDAVDAIVRVHDGKRR